MNKNELRINNIVGRKYTNPNPKGATTEIEPCFVKAIKDESVNISLSVKDKAILSKIKYTSIEPIKLTEEWLLKFGFTKGTDMWDDRAEYEYLFSEGKGVTVSDTNEIYMGCFSQTLKYVHQLQNLIYAMSGVELQLSST